MFLSLRPLLLLFLLSFFNQTLLGQVQLGSSIEGNEEMEQTGFDLDLNENGTRVVISTPYHLIGEPPTVSRVGKIFVMDLVNDEWQLVGEELLGINAFRIGYSVSMSEDGSRFIALSRRTNRALAWEWRNGEWTPLGEAVISQEAEFSISVVSISGDGKRIALGIPRSDTPGPDAGLVRIYELNNNSWQLVGEEIPGPEPRWAFGFDLDLSSDGRRVAVGAPGALNDDGETVGAVEVYEEVNGQWTRVGETMRMPEDTSGFGVVVDMSADGKQVVAGMSRVVGPEGEGQVMTFEEVNGEWEVFGTSPLMAQDEEREYGRALSLSADGNRLAVGALRRVVLYEKSNGEWATVVGELPTARSARAIALAGNGRILGYGDRGRDENTGVVRVFDMDRVVGVNDLYPPPYTVKLYPNPTSATLSITGPEESIKATPSLYHPDGSVLSAELQMTRPDVEHILLDLNPLSPGLYLLELAGMVYKVVKY